MALFVAHLIAQEGAGSQTKAGTQKGVREPAPGLLVALLRPHLLIGGGIWHADPGPIHHDHSSTLQAVKGPRGLQPCCGVL